MARTKILVVEDHPIFRKGVIALLKLEQDFEVVAEASDRPQALEAVDAQSPDLALVDLSLGEDNGLDLIKDILHRAPRTRILVLSMHDESLYAERAWAEVGEERQGVTLQDSPANGLVGHVELGDGGLARPVGCRVARRRVGQHGGRAFGGPARVRGLCHCSSLLSTS